MCNIDNPFTRNARPNLLPNNTLLGNNPLAQERLIIIKNVVDREERIRYKFWKGKE